MKERIQKLLSEAGYCSRRKAEELLEKADKALYVVKKNGRGFFAVYREVADQTHDYKKE